MFADARMLRHVAVVTLALVATHGKPVAPAADPVPTPPAITEKFEKTVKPFLQKHCNSCHGAQKPKGDLDLSPFTSVEAVAKDHKRWELVLDRLRVGDMPPENAKEQPSKELRAEVIAWVESLRTHEAEKNAGDPGPVPARRLSNAEYNNTIRDLTGVDIRPTSDFPVDPANEAGFDNSAESLTTSPALVKKYIDAARKVADHIALTQDGFVFAPHPVIADTDRDKFCVNRIVDFYKRQRTDFADYFYAAWQFKHREALGKPQATLNDFAMQNGISAKYLKTVWAIVNDTPEATGPLAALRIIFSELPDVTKPNDVRFACEKMRDFVVDLRKQLLPKVSNLKSPHIEEGSQPLVLWQDREIALNHTRYKGGAFSVSAGKIPRGSNASKAFSVPKEADAKKAYEVTFEKFCATFPDVFVISERGRIFLNEKSRGRLLSAGFHNQQGYFRDDRPMYDLLLDDAGQKELDRLWHEFELIADASVRQYKSFLWFERAESSYMTDVIFDEFRSEDKDCTTDAKMKKLEALYLAKTTKAGAKDTAKEAIRYFFNDMRTIFRNLEKARKDAEPTHLKSLLAFAEKAYRRPITATEKESLTAFYRTLREKEALGHEDAIRDCVVSVLMSPNYLFRVGQPSTKPADLVPLTDFALANRLSYFLWASMPDQELLAHANAGDLNKPDVLSAQVKRMLKDPKARGLAIEFGGNWLDFRRFEEHNAVDRTKFPAFDNNLRQAMFEEPVRFFTDVMARDGSVLDFLYAKHTFVNKSLAKHYGIPFPGEPAVSTAGFDGWVKIDDASKYGRGGLLPMSVFLTKNAPGLRTSPVKRGYWVVKRLLGEHIPAPPADVPELPADESKSERSLREALAKHREIKSCAGCHQRFDSLGLVFEGYGPVGERRTKDLGGRPIDAKASFPSGKDGDGLAGLTEYIRASRQQDFVNNLNQKLLAYALGRTLLLSDDKLLREMRTKLAAKEYRFSVLIETIVMSPQFLNQRGRVAQ